MSHALGSRRLLTTAAGYLGTGPSYTEPGDVLVVLYGSTVPVILRKASDGVYTVVGAVKIKGIMYGEALDDLREKK